MTTKIWRFSAVLIILTGLLSLSSCSCSSSEEKKMKKTRKKELKQEMQSKEFSVAEWQKSVSRKARLSEDELQILEKVMDSYTVRLEGHVSEDVRYSTKFLGKDLHEFTDEIRVGRLSIKTFEQLLNIEIDRYNAQCNERRIGRIRLDYIAQDNILTSESVSMLTKRFEEIDKMDKKSKEKKKLWKKAVTEELVRNFCEELDRQEIHKQLDTNR